MPWVGKSGVVVPGRNVGARFEDVPASIRNPGGKAVRLGE